MGYMTVKFIDKEYTIPEDVLTYIDLLDFTDNVQKQLMRAFHSKLNLENGFISDKDLADEMNQQAGAFIAKLCEYDIYNRTVNDYLKDNKGYQLFSDVNKAAFEKMKDLLNRFLAGRL